MKIMKRSFPMLVLVAAILAVAITNSYHVAAAESASSEDRDATADSLQQGQLSDESSDWETISSTTDLPSNNDDGDDDTLSFEILEIPSSSSSEEDVSLPSNNGGRLQCFGNSCMSIASSAKSRFISFISKLTSPPQQEHNDDDVRRRLNMAKHTVECVADVCKATFNLTGKFISGATNLMIEYPKTSAAVGLGALAAAPVMTGPALAALCFGKSGAAVVGVGASEAAALNIGAAGFAGVNVGYTASSCAINVGCSSSAIVNISPGAMVALMAGGWAYKEANKVCAEPTS